MNKQLVFIVTALMWSFATTAAVQVPGPLVEPGWVAKNMKDIHILDVRKDVKSFTGKPVYKKDKKTKKQKLVKVKGHIPGAALVNYKNVRGKKVIDGNKVTRVVPDGKAFEKLMRLAGLNKGDAVVIVSKGETHADLTMATRLYWTLKYYGHTNMTVLNGGTAQWIVDGNKTKSKATKFKKGNWSAGKANTALIATSAEVEQASKGKAQLVDTRPVSQYLGTYNKSYVYAQGHVAGAKNYPNELLAKPGIPARLTTGKQTQSLMKALNIDTGKSSITYCNSGHLATGSWFLMSEVLGNKNVKMYDGSMHQWTMEKRPTVDVTE